LYPLVRDTTTLIILENWKIFTLSHEKIGIDNNLNLYILDIK